MRFWSCVGEFLLVRWLFNRLSRRSRTYYWEEEKEADNPYSESDCGSYSSSVSWGTTDDTDYDSSSYSSSIGLDDECNSPAYDDFHEEQDAYDMMDDF